MSGGKADTAADALGTLLGFMVIVAPVLYASWDSIPLVNTAKWVILGVTLPALGFVAINARFRQNSAYQWLKSFFTVVLIVPGAAIACISFAGREQVLALKLFAITYLSFFPPWLYLQFIATKGKALWEEYVLNLYRLEVDEWEALPRPPETARFFPVWARADRMPAAGEQPTLYQRKFEGVFGPVQADTVRFRTENLFPVAITTLLISVGWVLVVQPESVFGFRLLGDAFQSNGAPQVPLQALRFAFLGSYFYVLQMLVRRYFQNDLKTGAYVSASMRIVIVLLLTWVLDLAYPGSVTPEQRMVVAFVIGVFPDVGWQALTEAVKVPLKPMVPSLKQDYPLSDLDGLNLWYESRLMEEGIENLQNLVTANLVDLMLNTRIPVDRLVDWVDQATLYLHLGKAERDRSPRQLLRRYGIRTATDLEEALTSGDDEQLARLSRVLNDSDAEPSVLRAVAASFQNEPNLMHVRAWRSHNPRSAVGRAQRLYLPWMARPAEAEAPADAPPPPAA